MIGIKLRLGRTARLFLLSALAACLGSGIASATCAPTLPQAAGSVPCFINVQPIDVGTIPPGATTPVYAPFNTTSSTGNPPAAGTPVNNPTSLNPIGFVLDPGTGTFPGQTGYPGTGVDVTRALLNNIGVDLVWQPMTKYVYPTCPAGDTSCGAAAQDFTALSVGVAPTGPQLAGSCNGYISGTTLTVTSCSTLALAVYDVLSCTLNCGTTFQSGTYISALLTGSGGTGTYTVTAPNNVSQTVGSSKKAATFTGTSGTLSSQKLLTLADQPGISQGQAPSPTPPLNLDPTVINLFFVNKLNPPTSGGTLYGFSLIGNNGVAIGGNTFFAPTPLQARPDTIAHELLHNLGLKHETYGAGAYNPYNATSNPFGGIVQPVLTANPFVGECDPNYPACAANLMTSGDLRTEPTLTCVLNGYNGAMTPGCTGQPSFPHGTPPLGTADQVTTPAQESAAGLPTSLPTSQQRAVLAGGSGLLQSPAPIITSPTNLGGLSQPIPYETTTARLETGDGPAGGVTFDVSGPVDGKPGETLTAWILSLPEGNTFAGQSEIDVISQSRKDLVQEVSYYPNAGQNPLRRNIAYTPGADNNADTPAADAIGPSPCAATTAACIVVKFAAPGLLLDDAVSFSQKILSGGDPIAKDDLCKAKITYVFSDGYTTTSNFGRCSPDSRPLISSSWRPDPHVAPQFTKSNLLLAQALLLPPPALPCTPVQSGDTFVCPDPTTTPPEDADPTREGGQLGQSCSGGATIGNSSDKNVSGTIPGPNITVGIGQRCNYTNCEFLGSLTINGGNVFLGSCVVDGNLTMTSGTLNMSPSTQVIGNVQIANGDAGSILRNGFQIGPNAQIAGGLTIQNLPANEPGFVCGSTVSGGVTLKNNQSSIEIGGSPTSCQGNTISGGLSCKGNTPAPIGGGNSVSGGSSGQCTGF